MLLFVSGCLACLLSCSSYVLLCSLFLVFDFSLQPYLNQKLMGIKSFTLLTLSLLFFKFVAFGQTTFVDENGVIRYTETNEELCAFGTNYAVPFSYWDARLPIGADQMKAIDEDVYHIARLGLDAYRIHVWFDYISDENGNLVYNEHFQLFDYLLYKLKERNIKIFITPMYNAKVDDKKLWPAQQNYLRQFVAHVNPYTKLAYKND